MKAFFFAILSLYFTSISFAQSLTGKVTDLKTKEPLPYVHIGVLNRNLGVISRDDGSFEINLSTAKPEEELMFSMVGYEVMKLKVGDIKELTLSIKLVPKTYQLKEVVVRAQKVKDLKKLGRYKTTGTTTGHSGSEVYGFGGEWGLKIYAEKTKYKILDARFHLRFNTVDSALFRIHIYAAPNGMPGESLLKKEAFVKSRSKQQWIICDLESQDIVLDQDVVVTYEVVRLWYNNKKDNQLFFTHGTDYDKGLRFSRASSQDQWKMNESPPIVLYLSGEEVKP